MFGMTGPVPLLLFIGSPADIVVILLVAVLLFGGKKIPELAKGLGEGIKHFKSSVKEDDEKETAKKSS